MLLITYIFAQPLFWFLVTLLCLLAIALATLAVLKLCDPLFSIKGKRKAQEAIGFRVAPYVARLASNKGGNMAHDTRFALIDTDGDARFAAIIDGTFQNGKAKDATPTNIEEFARAILFDGKDGRFVCADGRKPGILKSSGRAREAVAYRVAPEIAAKLGIPPQGNR
jgi:hypothetical protein